MLAVPLVDEARALADEAVDELARLGLPEEAEALVLKARAALLDGDLTGAEAAAARAGDLFARQGRARWTLLARQVLLRARYLAGERTPELADASQTAADELASMGWRTLALNARLDSARTWMALDQPERARELLRSVGRARRGGTASTRVLGWYAQALLQRLDCRPEVAVRSLRRGLTVADEYRATLSPTAMRVGSGVHGIALAREGLDLAMRDGRPAQVFAWSERCRAGALRVTPARAPRDVKLSAALTELRMVAAEHEQALVAGGPVDALAGRRSALERVVRDRASVVGAGVRSSVVDVPSVSSLSRGLGSRALVQLTAHLGLLHAVVVRGGRATLHPLGEESVVQAHAQRLAFALRRCVSADRSVAAEQAALVAAHRLAEKVDDQLLAPLRRRVGEDEIVLVPTPSLHALAWPLLPTLRERPLTVTPSSTLYVRAATAGLPPDAARPTLVAGPGLPGARREVESLAQLLPAARVLVDDAATSAAVVEAMEGASLVHVAAHGRFRADNPLFSSLQLTDGPLTLYGLEEMRTPPTVVVLSACSSGLSAVRPGDELMGLSASLLGMGTRVLVAAVAAVHDEAAAYLLEATYRGLADGLVPAAALARAQSPLLAGDAVSAATAAGFACFGAGFEVVSTPRRASAR